MFPYMVCLYIPHVPFGVKIDTFSPASKRTANHIAYRLVINTNVCPISCTVSKIRRLIGWKLRMYHTPLSFNALARGWTFSNFCMNFLSQKTRVLVLSVGEDFVILAFVVLTRCQRTTVVVQTDRRTDGQPIVANTGRQHQHSLSYADAL